MAAPLVFVFFLKGSTPTPIFLLGDKKKTPPANIIGSPSYIGKMGTRLPRRFGRDPVRDPTRTCGSCDSNRLARVRPICPRCRVKRGGVVPFKYSGTGQFNRRSPAGVTGIRRTPSEDDRTSRPE